jgi:hypothetical protein
VPILSQRRTQGIRMAGVHQGHADHDPCRELEALAAASKFARARYEATGEPTGVRVRMPCGDALLMAAHG